MIQKSVHEKVDGHCHSYELREIQARAVAVVLAVHMQTILRSEECLEQNNWHEAVLDTHVQMDALQAEFAFRAVGMFRELAVADQACHLPNLLALNQKRFDL